jgi:uncharacterized membrane protein
MANASPLTEKPNAETVPTSGAVGTIIDGHYAPPPKDGDGKTWVRTSALVQAQPEALYNMWRDIETAPFWQEEISSVTALDGNRSEWVMQHGDKTIKWTSEILADEPGKRIAWRSIEGQSHNAGEVVFEPSPGGRGTVVTLLQEFGTGALANAAATLTGRNPKQAVIENLRHFKALAETGEIPRSRPQPHGDRGIIGSMKKSAYGENIQTPEGISEKVS